MKLLGNYRDWITPELIEVLLSNDGDVTPVYQPEKWAGKEELDKERWKVELAGYPKLNYHFCQFTKDTECIKSLINQDLILPFDVSKPVYHWWIIKLNPGQMQPMHFDPHLIEVKNPTRYTMMLQDYQPGHVFVHDDFMLKDYRAGDLFEWQDSYCYHGVVNIGHAPRLSLQISAFELQ
jgi:hypothetical protein